jgi:non-heme chloroperoxidase
VKGAKAVFIPGAPHALPETHQDKVNAELLAFLQRAPATDRQEVFAAV